MSKIHNNLEYENLMAIEAKIQELLDLTEQNQCDTGDTTYSVCIKTVTYQDLEELRDEIFAARRDYDLERMRRL